SGPAWVALSIYMAVISALCTSYYRMLSKLRNGTRRFFEEQSHRSGNLEIDSSVAFQDQKYAEKFLKTNLGFTLGCYSLFGIMLMFHLAQLHFPDSLEHVAFFCVFFSSAGNPLLQLLLNRRLKEAVPSLVLIQGIWSFWHKRKCLQQYSSDGGEEAEAVSPKQATAGFLEPRLSVFAGSVTDC
ncbi:unnamed protein product, partial [Heterosigma akashiwo]